MDPEICWSIDFPNIENCDISMSEAVSGLQIELREAKSRADAQH